MGLSCRPNRRSVFNANFDTRPDTVNWDEIVIVKITESLRPPIIDLTKRLSKIVFIIRYGNVHRDWPVKIFSVRCDWG